MEAAGVGAIVVILLILLMVIYLGILGIAIGDYVMQAYALYKLAARRGIENPWLAWIPVAQDWIIGALAEQYDIRKQKQNPWKKIMIVMAIISIGSAFVMQIVSYIISFAASAFGTASAAISGDSETAGIAVVVLMFVVMILVLCVLSVVQMAYYYCQTLCIFKIFESTVPEKALKYILLYLLVPLAGGICLLKCKEKGYPEPFCSSQPFQSAVPVMNVTPVQEIEVPVEEEMSVQETEVPVEEEVSVSETEVPIKEEMSVPEADAAALATESQNVDEEVSL